MTEAIEAEKTQVFFKAGPSLQQVVAMDPSAGLVIDVAKALRGALRGINFPAEATRSDEEVAVIQQMQLEQAQKAGTARSAQGRGGGGERHWCGAGEVSAGA